MLNGADSYEGGGNAGEAKEKLNDAEALFGRLKRQVKADYNSKGQVNWRRDAREDFDFDAGEQLNEEDKAILPKRPIVVRDTLTFLKIRNLVGASGDVWTPTNHAPPRGGVGLGASRVHKRKPTFLPSRANSPSASSIVFRYAVMRLRPAAVSWSPLDKTSERAQ
jgi:hypothetical protein